MNMEMDNESTIIIDLIIDKIETTKDFELRKEIIKDLLDNTLYTEATTSKMSQYLREHQSDVLISIRGEYGWFARFIRRIFGNKTI